MTDTHDMLKDSRGRYVPREMVRDLDLLRDEVVRSLVDEARILSDCLAQARERIYLELGAFLTLSAEQYGASYGGNKGNVTLMSFDGRFKLTRQIQDHIVFDERLQAAKTLIDDCVREWSHDSNTKIQTLVQHAFQVDKTGKVSTERILSLRRLAIDDPTWARAMQAIGDAIQVTNSTTYLRFYERDTPEQPWRPIPIDLTNARQIAPPSKEHL